MEPRSPPSAALGVQAMQALIAGELVERFGLPERKAAGLLGIVPSSVSQYLSGKRLGSRLAAHRADPAVRRIAARAAQRLMTGGDSLRTVLEATLDLAAAGGAAGASPAAVETARSRAVPRQFRERILGEQRAVAECMHLALRSRDEMTRALFRQIAADSLRHAEIVAALSANLDRGITTSGPTGIDRHEVELLLEREREAESSESAGLAEELGGVMRILWESMEADERKHELLLRRLIATGFPTPPAPSPGGRARATRQSDRSPGRRPSPVG